MRALALIMIGGLALSACGERAQEPASAEAPAPAASDAALSAPPVLSAADLRRVCRAGLATVHGQTVEAIEIEGVTGETVAASWRAPVDGGRMRAECRVERDLVTWKPLGLPDPAQERWMNQSGDPVARFALDGDAVTITQTSPDGATERSQLTVPADQEAR